jgi:hypothetical protein
MGHAVQKNLGGLPPRSSLASGGIVRLGGKTGFERADALCRGRSRRAALDHQSRDQHGLVGGVGSVGGKFVPGQNYRVDKMAETGLYEDRKNRVRRPGDPDQRIKDMDRDGVDAERCCASTMTG